MKVDAPGPEVVSARRLRRVDACAYALTLLAFAASAVTGIVGWLGSGRLSGWLLLAHMTSAPVFIGGLAVLTMRLAERCRFRFPQSRTETAPTLPPVAPLSVGQKAVFWFTLAFGFVVIASMTVAMLPVFGYAAQRALVEVHRYAGCGLLIVAIAHGCLLLAPGGRR